MDYELQLFDRIEVIRTANRKYDLESNAYISFSGGKDSTVLHHLVDLALPGNQIPRVFIDTGIEYKAIRDFVLDMASKDDRFRIIKPTKPIKGVLETYGYPFKSKQHSHNLAVYQHSGMGRSVERYLGTIESNTKFRCPKSLIYQFTDEFQLKVSDQCCLRLKKNPVHKWERENGRRIAMTGMRQAEGGERASIKGCILTDKNGNVSKFHPLLVVSDEWEDKFVRERDNTMFPLLRAVQLQADGLQRLSVRDRPARATDRHGTLPTKRAQAVRNHLGEGLRRVPKDRVSAR